MSYKYGTHTFGSESFMAALRAAQEGELPGGKYPVEFNSTDFTVFVQILKNLALYGTVSYKGIPVIPGYGEEGTLEAIEDWAVSWLNGIAETLGVEGI